MANPNDPSEPGLAPAEAPLALLNAIVAELPVAVTVRGEDGRALLVNQAASRQLGLPAGSAFEARATLAPAVSAGPAQSREEQAGRNSERTLVTAQKPVRIGAANYLLTASLDITERKRTENELLRRAYFDELTGLPNRSLVEQHVAEIIAQKADAAPFALAFIDIDNFKHINDYYSHAIGDALLVRMTERIARHIRPSDLLARISGDEFVLIVDPMESDEQVRSLIGEVLELIKRPFHIEGYEIFSSASIGVCRFPEHGRDYETLRRNADNAMYRAKSGAKGGASFFDAEIGQAVSARMALEQRLRLAIRDRRFCCAFQPKVDIRTTEVIGIETLVRLRDENGVIQGPSDFIGLAVELGLIDDIARLVLIETMDSIDLINEAFGAAATISINVAAKQAGDLHFMRAFAGALAETGCPQRFMIEVTEDAFLAKNDFQSQVLPLLREVGVRVSIDDFGTGYSSLAQLKRMPVSELKIDKSFVLDLRGDGDDDARIVRSTIELAHGLGLAVTAEGVETPAAWHLLAGFGCDRAQGYLISKPLPADAFEAWLVAIRDAAGSFMVEAA